MRLVDSISSTVNSGLTGADQVIKKIAGNPSTAKKLLQLAGKIFAAIDLYHVGQVQKRDFTDAMKGTTDIIEFYGYYKNLMFWINLFSKESLDQDTLKNSIESSLCASHRDPKDRQAQKKIAHAVFDEVMKTEAYHSKGEVLEALKVSLEKQGYTSSKAKTIAERVIIQQKARSPIQLLYMACFTITDLSGNLMTLKKWRILDLSHAAMSIGGQSRVFMFVVNVGVDTVLGTVASAGLILVVGEAAYRTVNAAIKHYYAVKPNEREQAYKELRNALFDLAVGSVDLGATAAPLLFTLNPPVLVAFAIVAKGTGLICILIR